MHRVPTPGRVPCVAWVLFYQEQNSEWDNSAHFVVVRIVVFTSLTPDTHDLRLANNISRAKTEFQHNICFLPVYISHPQMNMLDAIHEASEFPDPLRLQQIQGVGCGEDSECNV